MKKVYVLILGCLLGNQIVQAQATFQKSYGGSKDDSGRYLDICSDGGYIIVGYTKSFSSDGNEDMFVVRTDVNGQESWSKTIGGSKLDIAHSVACVTGGFIVAGTTSSYSSGGDQDAFLMKLDESGNQVWIKYYGGSGLDVAKEVRMTSDGGYIVTGYTALNNSYIDAMLLKTDGDGNQQWIKNYGGNAYYDHGYSVRQTPDGGYIFVGKIMYSSNLDDADTYLVKTDANGNKQWEKMYGGQDEEEGQYIALTSDGGYIFASDSKSSTAGDYDALVIKTDANGNQQWRKLFGGSAKDIAKSIEPTSDGGYILGGITRTNLPNPDYWLVKMNSSGDYQWEKNYGGSNHEHLYLTRQTSDGGYIIVGHESSLAGPNGEDVWLVKTNAQGVVTVSEKFDLSSLINVFPNPNKGSFKITIPENMKNVSVAIFDATGRRVYDQKAIEKDERIKNIALSNVVPGLYFMELIADEKKTVKKITVH